MKLKPQNILGVFAISVVGLITYYPASRIGLLNNDWYYLEQVARLSLPQYFIQYFDPRLQTGWYRPVFGILYLVVYALYGPDPVAHHMAHIILHTATSALLFVIVLHVSKKIRLSVIAGLVYVGLPVYSKAVYWPSVPDPLSMFFYLLAIWFWIKYLETSRMGYAIATFLAFLLGLMTKETSVTLPIALFLVDRLLITRPTTWSGLARRYAPFVATLSIYVATEYAIQHNGSYVNLANYGFGSHMIWNLIEAMTLVTFPWELGSPLRYVWLSIAGSIIVASMIFRRSKALVFLIFFAVLNILPVLGFPGEWFEMRYLYISTMASAVIIAYLFDWVWNWLGPRQWLAGSLASVVVVILLINQSGVSTGVASWGEIARQRRVPFREIMQQLPSIPEDTYLYFADSPITPLVDLSVMFLLQYGKSVTVEGADNHRIMHAQGHATSYIYYFDDAGHPISVQVDPTRQVSASPSLPVNFQGKIQLEGYEIAQSRVKRGNPLVLLLYWRAIGKIDEDYTIFLHLVDERGQIVSGYDGEARNGSSHTSQWRENDLVIDPHIFELSKDLTVGEYYLEIGLYYLPNQERLTIVNDHGNAISDQIVFSFFQVIE